MLRDSALCFIVTKGDHCGQQLLSIGALCKSAPIGAQVQTSHAKRRQQEYDIQDPYAVRPYLCFKQTTFWVATEASHTQDHQVKALEIGNAGADLLQVHRSMLSAAQFTNGATDLGNVAVSYLMMGQKTKALQEKSFLLGQSLNYYNKAKARMQSAKYDMDNIHPAQYLQYVEGQSKYVMKLMQDISPETCASGTCAEPTELH